MKVSELSGTLLDYWVAQCELNRSLDELELRDAGQNRWTLVDKEDGSIMGLICSGIRDRSKARRELSLPPNVFYYWPSGDWAYGGPLIEREISLLRKDGTHWTAIPHDGPNMEGATGLEAACRAIVASKFGREVPDLPEE